MYSTKDSANIFSCYILHVICYLIRALGLIGKTTDSRVSELKRDIESWDLGYTLSFEQNCTSVDTNSVSELGSGINQLRPQPKRGLLWNPRIHRSQDQERKEEAIVLCVSWAFKGVTVTRPPSLGARQPDDIASTTVWKRTATDVFLYPSLVYQRPVLVTRTSVNLPSSHMNTYHSEYYVHTGGARTLLTSSIQTEKAKKTGNPRNRFWFSFSVVCTCRCQTNVQRCIHQFGKIMFYNNYYCVRFGIIGVWNM